MSYKDAAKKSQGFSDRIKLPVDQVIKAKAETSEETFKGKKIIVRTESFSYWDKDATNEKGGKGSEVKFNKPLIGYIVGKAMRLSCYDKNIGGSFNTPPYLTNSSVVPLYGPAVGGKSDKVFTGTIDQIIGWLSQHSDSKAIKKTMCIYIVTEQGKFIELQTNVSIAIDQTKAYSKLIIDHLFSFTPTMYDNKNPDISDSCKKILREMADTNPPCYAKIEPVKELSEEQAEQMGVENFCNIFAGWKDQFTAPAPVEETPAQAAPVKRTAPAPKQEPVTESYATEGKSDDLPF